MASEKPVRLTGPQRDALVAVGMGAMIYYGPQNNYRGYFSFAPYNLRASASTCPVVARANTSCQVLVRLKLVDATSYSDGRHATATLSAAGRVRFEATLTQAERAGMADEVAETNRRAMEDAAKAHKQAWARANSDELAELREAGHARGSERHQQEHRMSTIARLLGEGANNVEELVAELRGIVRRLRDLEAEGKASKARLEELSEPPDSF